MGEEQTKVEEEAKPVTGVENKVEESKDLPPPQEVVLRVFMHCEGCARKVRRCLRGLEGVEDVITDCKTHKVTVKGEKADPMKVLERLEKKCHRKVELLLPVPTPTTEDPKKPEQEDAPKQEEKKDELPPPVITVVLKVHMHCEACAQGIRKRILRIKGVESAVPDQKNSQVVVKGTFPAAELVEHVHKTTGKTAVILTQDPEPKTEENKTDQKDGGDKKEEEKNVGEDAEKQEAAGKEDTAAAVMEMRKNGYHYYYHHPVNYQVYPSSYVTEPAYTYPSQAPQMFSDENPNACSVM